MNTEQQYAANETHQLVERLRENADHWERAGDSFTAGQIRDHALSIELYCESGEKVFDLSQ